MITYPFKSNIGYLCKSCGAKNILLPNYKSIYLAEDNEGDAKFSTMCKTCKKRNILIMKELIDV